MMIFISLIGIIFLLFGIKPLVSSIKEKNIYAVVRLSSFILTVLTMCIGFFLLGIWYIEIENYKTVEEYIFLEKLGDIASGVLNASILFIGLCSLIYIVSVNMERKKKEEKVEQQKRIAEKQKEEEEKCKYNKLQEIKYRFNSKSEELKKLIDQYYSAVCNYIESLPFKPFLELNDIESEFSPRLIVSQYWNNSSDLLRYYIKEDKFVPGEVDGLTDEMKLVQENTRIFVSELMDRISSSWNDNETISSAVYFIIRNNIIRRYHDILHDDGICTITDLIENTEGLSDEATMCTAKAFYTYYWLYTNDINLSIKSTYDRLSEEIDKQYEIYLLQAKKDYFFSDNNFDFQEDEIPMDIDSEDDADILSAIDMMSGREFEEFIANFFKKQGYKTTLTPSSGDYGIDVIIENDFLKIGIQTKCYSDKVSNSAVQEAVTGIKHYGLDKAMVITNNYFQPSAIRLAKENNVILWDREKLEEELSK